MSINLLSPLKLKNHFVLKNRIVIPAMASGTADSSGNITSKTLEHYKRLSQSKAAIIFCEYSYIHPNGKSAEGQLGIYDDAQIEGVSKISSLIKRGGALSGFQIVHGGSKSTREITGGKLIAPSAISVPVKDKELEIPDEASIEDIIFLKKSYLDAAFRAYEAGHDIVEIHCAHGYGLNQWVSEITNQRSDRYGGTLEKRCNLLFEIIQEMRELLPSLLISVRVPGQDHYLKGLTLKDSLFICQGLQKIGVDIINISSGIGGCWRPGGRSGEGYLVEDASYIKNKINLPVIGVGGIQTDSYINKMLKEKSFDLAAVGRAILENPSWGEEFL